MDVEAVERIRAQLGPDGGSSPALLDGNKQVHIAEEVLPMPCGRKRKRHKIATHKRKKRLRKNRHKKKNR